MSSKKNKIKKLIKYKKRIDWELENQQKNPCEYFSFGKDKTNDFKLNFILFGPNDSPFEGGIFEGVIDLDINYPDKAPSVTFKGSKHVPILYHPNIYSRGKVCISILHEGVDNTEYESSDMRWRGAINGINGILMSIYLMLEDPNFESPANIDAGNMWRKDYEKYKNKIYKIVSLSQKSEDEIVSSKKK